MDDAWHQDQDNPQNWSKARRIFQTVLVAWIALTCTLGSSIYAPAHHQIMSRFHTSTTVAILPLSLYILGLGFGPVLTAPGSETLGRKAVYLFCMPVFAAFTIGGGFSNGIASLCVCRLFAGMFASPGLSIGSASIADIWSPAERAMPMALYVACPFLGPALGPLIGSFVVQEEDWRWAQWVTLFSTAVALGGILAMKETYKKIILKRRTKRQTSLAPVENTTSEKTSKISSFREWAQKDLMRPLHMLTTEPIVGILSLYVTFTFATMYAFFAVTPMVFDRAFGFDLEQQGLAYVGMAIGVVVTLGLLVAWAKYIYRPQVAQWRRNETAAARPAPPEFRLLPALVASPILPAGLFLFGWAAEYKTHWIAPIIGMALISCGHFLVFMTTTMYITDCYGPLHGASAMAGNTMLRYCIGAIVPLFAIQLFTSLGFGWASSLLAFVGVVLGMFPWVLLWYGQKLRERQKYANSN